MSEADTTAASCGIRKKKSLKVLCTGANLSVVGDISAEMSEVIAKQLISYQYVMDRDCRLISESKQKAWAEKTKEWPAQLKCLPPTSEAFVEQVKRAHLQSADSCLEVFLGPHQPVMDPVGY